MEYSIAIMLNIIKIKKPFTGYNLQARSIKLDLGGDKTKVTFVLREYMK